MRLPITLGLALFAVWMLWSGHTDALLVGFGVASVVLVVVLATRMRLVDAEGVPDKLPFRTLRFFPYMFWEIVKANLDVARRILDPELPIHPSVFRVKAGQRRDLGVVVYANCITLTPGTVSVDVEGDEIVVHALSREAAAGVRSGTMEREVARFEVGH